ncbi:MAG: hypothetical protein PHI86_04740 [Candidatus Omnitrophica bacterium]|jgi:hypothetical protein|nr:hypothetical protein [Candidatus Omnitrophota bacterium]
MAEVKGKEAGLSRLSHGPALAGKEQILAPELGNGVSLAFLRQIAYNLKGSVY